MIFPLGLVRQAVEEAGMDISHAWEDLVFLSHNGFLLQFGSKQNEIILHLNGEAQGNELEGDIDRLHQTLSMQGMQLMIGNSYRLKQEENENIQLEFY